MQLKLKFFATFREAVGSKVIHREFDDGSTVGDVLAALEGEYEGLDLLEDGGLRPQINVLKNGREVLHMAGPETPMTDGDTLAIFPPVAGGGRPAPDAGSEPDRRERSFRGISRRLARHYLSKLGGDPVTERRVEGDQWRADLSSETVSVGPSLTLNEVTIVFEGDPEALDALLPRFEQKAVRAGG
jgi:molybdopterin synthase sulfur carrier subunit